MRRAPLAAEHHLDGDEIMRVAHGRPTVETMRLGAPHLPAEEEAARLDAAEAFDTDGVPAVEGTAQLLQLLPPDAWASATSGTKDTAMTRVRHIGVPSRPGLITA